MDATGAAPAGLDLLRPDRFASAHLGRAVYRLVRPDRAREALDGIAGAPGPLMIEVKAPVDRVELAGQLTRLGFWVIDTSVQLEAAAARGVAVAGGAWRVRDARPADRPEVARVAGDNLTTSRYHLDPRIDPAGASALKRAWAANFFEGLRGQRLLVVEHDRGVGGFLLALEQGPKGVIDLIAVDPILRGTGAAAGLVRTWLAGSPQLATVQVGTQISNLGSLKAYHRMGFRVCAASYVLHYIRDDAGGAGA